MRESLVPSKVPPGGPSTITGVLAQALRALSLCVESERYAILGDSSSDETQGLTLILEPASGGDLAIRSRGRREIEQIKTRSGGRTWSFQQFVEDVLPDLYRAVREGEPCTYRFITDGEIGGWSEVKELFESWGARVGSDQADALDDVREIRTGSKQETLSIGRGHGTERSLFQEIVKSLRTRKPASVETEEITRLKTWTLLSNLRIEAGKDFQAMQDVVEAWLRRRIDVIEDLDKVRGSLVADLLSRAAAGEARIDVKQFFLDHRLTARDLADWDGHIRAANRILRARLAVMDIDGSRDPRPELARVVIDRWRAGPPILVVTGASGHGKSWLLSSILSGLSDSGELIALRESSHNADADLRALADAVWQDTMGHNTSVPFSQLIARIQDEAPLSAVRPIYLGVDGVVDASQGKRLVREVLIHNSLRLVLACPPATARDLEEEFGERLQKFEVQGFFEEEIRQFLARAIGDGWAEIPSDVRETLRTPLLADIYRRLASGGGWRPVREYELYEGFWARLVDHGSANRAMDAALLGEAALRVLKGGRYPWTPRGIVGASGDGSFVPRAIAAGWLLHIGQGLYQVTHERLLNWAVAEGAVAAFRNGELTGKELVDRLSQTRNAPASPPGPMGYVLLDVLWLLTAPDLPPMTVIIDEILAEHESDPLVRTDVFYGELLQTLGPRILPVLLRRLGRTPGENDEIVGTHVVAGIIALDAPGVPTAAGSLLQDRNPVMRRLGARVLRDRPAAEALDALWRVHCDQAENPTPFLRWPSEHRAFIQEDTMSALHACVALQPAWLERALEQVESKSPRVCDLGWLLAEVGEPALWHQLKRTLFEKLPDNRRTSFAANIEAYGDSAEATWLAEQTGGPDGHIAALALSALVRVDPALAISALHALTDEELRISGHWHLHRLLVQQPEETRRALLARLTATGSPWSLALALQGAEDHMGPALLDFLLDSFAPLVEAATTGPSEDSDGGLFRPLHMLNRLSDPELLYRVRARRGSHLEFCLTRWLTEKGPPAGSFRDALQAEGLNLLAKIGGSGFTQVLNKWLQGERYAQMHAMELVARRPNSETLGILRAMAEGTDESDRARLDRGLAATALLGCGDQLGALRYVLRNGLKSRAAVLDQLERPVQMDEELRAATVSALRDDETVAGACMVLGLSQDEGLRLRLYDVLDSHKPESEAAIAAVVALGWMKDGSALAVSHASRVMSSGTYEHLAIDALWQMGTDEADQVLWQRLDRQFHEGIALALLERPALRARIVPLLHRRLRDASAFRRLELVQSLVDEPGLESVLGTVFDERELREFIRASVSSDDDRLNMWGGQVTVIRALAVFDPNSAFDAAKAALRRKGKGRERYPYLLVKFGGPRAVDALLEWAKEEPMDSVLRAIGRALSSSAVAQQLVGMSESGGTRNRVVACRLAAYARQGEQVRMMLSNLEGSTTKSVADAARSALSSIAQGKLAERLADAIIVEADPTHRWVLLDGFLSVVDPGDAGEPLPPWTTTVADGLPPAMRQHLSRGVVDRRKKQGA